MWKIQTLIIYVVLAFLCSCGGNKELNSYITKSKVYLIENKGTPAWSYEDNAGIEQIQYSKHTIFYNPNKYSDARRTTTFYVNPEGNVFKWRKRTFTSNLGSKPKGAIY